MSFAQEDLHNYSDEIEEEKPLAGKKKTSFKSTGANAYSPKQLTKREIKKAREQYTREKIDNLFEIPLIVSICMLAMAHGSNEINVAAPLSAMIFLLDGNSSELTN